MPSRLMLFFPEFLYLTADAPAGKITLLPQGPQDLGVFFRPGAAQGVLRCP